MILNNIKISPLHDDADTLRAACAKQMGVPIRDLGDMRILRRSIDARHKDSVTLIYSVECCVKGDSLPDKKLPEIKKVASKTALRPVVVGSGPAGMLCALILAQAGLSPLVLERGLPVSERAKAVSGFFAGGKLNTECNVQFGEGGAGTFSDGKLNTGIKDGRIARVFAEFIEAGAPPEIAFQAKPHVGTDKLRVMVEGMRKKIESLGGEYLFSARLDDIVIKNGRLASIIYSQCGQSHELECDKLVLATGHSARDTFEMLYDRGVPMERKPFSIGARVEHPQPLIDRAQYGKFAGLPALGAADYKLSAKTQSGRGVYTFCMCPGGSVVAAASEEGGIATNGMSLYARDGANANSALLVGITPDDFGSEHPLAGMHLQRRIERAAFSASGSYKAPAQLMGDFLAGQASSKCASVAPSYRPGVVFGEISCCLPDFITRAMAEGCLIFDRKLHGFAHPDAVLTAPETRSSSPVRILRGVDMQSSVRGLYPCGEGAGYAGGITSAAVDGIKCAEAIIASYGG